MSRAQTFRQIVKHFGWGWVGYRAYHTLIHKTGALERRLPAIGWDDLKPEAWLSNPALASPEALAEHRAKAPVRFLFDPADRDAYREILCQWDDGSDWAGDKIDAIERGALSYFFNDPIDVGFPPKWNDNLLEKKPGPTQAHFSHLNEFASGDVKCIWEPNRFAFAYDLVRAYWRTGDERAPQLFWNAAEDWVKHNPPNMGINWKCGQESTFRAMACCFALWGFADSPETTPARSAMVAKMMAVTARRIEPHLRYALSQKNNHGISEAMGLFTIGLLFPELKGSARWVEKGEKYLESQARELIYDDGAFSQNAANYHRVMLHDFLYAIRIGQLNGRPLSDTLLRRVAHAGRFLVEIQDEVTGHVPRYGQDDGALILPLSHAPYDDYRPVAQSAVAVTGDGALPWASGQWDEEVLWLLGRDALDRGNPAAQSASCLRMDRDANFSAALGGNYIMRGSQGMAFMRAQNYRHRPAQLDELHTDIWWRGHNIALDPGTYSYNGEDVWAPIPLALTGAHNTPTLEGQEQAGRAGRFMFLPWPAAQTRGIETSANGHIASLVMQHTWATGQTDHRHVIRLGPEHWVVLDDLCQVPNRDRGLNWNLIDAPYAWNNRAGRLDLTLASGSYGIQVGQVGGDAEWSLVRGEANTPRGWYAPRYQKIEPCLSLRAAIAKEADPGEALYTVLGPGDVRIESKDENILSIYHEDWSAEIEFYAYGHVESITLTGALTDRWQGTQYINGV